MQTQLRLLLLPRRPLISGLLALILPLCLLAGGLTATTAHSETCEPQAVTADFCSKFTQHGDGAAVVPKAVVSADGWDLTPHLLPTEDTFTHPLPDYLTTPSGRSPPLL